MDNQFLNIGLPRRWARVAMIVGVATLIMAPLTAMAAHSFTDVPSSNTFHDDIAAIADAGVTKGCNPPANTEYCPDDFVTREQMAAFMNRLGALGPGQTPVANAATAVEADTLDGYDAEDVIRVYGNLIDDDIDDFVSGSFTDLIDVTAVAPVDGFLHITGSVSAEDDCSLAAFGHLQVRLTVDGDPTHDEAGAFQMTYECPAQTITEDFAQTTALTAVVPVSAGTHAVALQAQEAGNGSFITGRAVSVVFSPFGTGVATPVSVSDPGPENLP